MKIDLVKLVKIVLRKDVLDAIDSAVMTVEAVNSTKEYKYKDKVDKTLQGASKALQVVRIIKGLVGSK